MSTEKTAEAVMDDVFSSDRDRGPTPPPAAEPEKQIDLETAITEAVDAQRTVPLKTLTGEREKYKGLLTEAEKRAIVAEERLKLYEEQQSRNSRQAQQPQRQVPVPDVFSEPDKFTNHILGETEQRLFTQSLHFSERFARREHGKEAVDEAFNAAKAKGLIDRGYFIQNNPDDPWGAMVEWHKKEKFLETVGPDPDVYRKKIEDEVRAKLASEGKAGGTATPGAPPQRFPGTLADATATGQQGAHLTTEAVMKSAFSSDRDRRK